MSGPILALVLLASVLHAFWNYLAKKANGQLPFIWLMYVGSALLYLPVILYLLYTNQVKPSQALAFFCLSSAIIHLAYFIVLQTGYRKADLSIVYPLARGSGPLFSCIIAVLFLKETFSFLSLSGLLFIIAGVLVITRFQINFKKNQKLAAGLFYGIATGFLIAAYTINDNIAVRDYHISPLLITLASHLFGTVVLFPVVMRQRDEIRREIHQHKWSILAISVLSPVAYILILIALQRAPLVAVAPAREASILFGVFMGSRLLNEKEAKRRTVASLLIITGIACLALS